MKAADKIAKQTPDMLRRRPGRPANGDAPMTGAQRLANLRASRKAAGLCTCCGQPLPVRSDPAKPSL